MLRTAQSLPLKGFRHWASTRSVSRPSRQSATGPPDELTTKDHLHKVTSSLLVARKIKVRAVSWYPMVTHKAKSGMFRECVRGGMEKNVGLERKAA